MGQVNCSNCSCTNKENELKIEFDLKDENQTQQATLEENFIDKKPILSPKAISITINNVNFSHLNPQIIKLQAM